MACVQAANIAVCSDENVGAEGPKPNGSLRLWLPRILTHALNWIYYITIHYYRIIKTSHCFFLNLSCIHVN